MYHHLKKSMRMAIFASLCTLAGMPAAWSAESNVDIGTVQATTTGNGTEKQNTAAANAPSKTPLKVSQPTSVVSKHYIKNNVAPTGNYDDIVKVTPNVTGTSPNGPGLMEDVTFQMRGLQDGQYLVTFDGMPWSDSNDFTHHTTSYFMAHDLTQASVDRGPGTAATVGQATFGGTIALHSKMPDTVGSFNPYVTIGSWNTQLYGLEYDTGIMPNNHGASALIDYENLKSDGYLTYSGQQRQNAFMKIVDPLSDNTTVTLSAMYNNVHQYVPFGATKAELASGQWNLGLTNNPALESYYGYNYDNIHTDFEYIDLQSYLGDQWTLDNKLYTYAYYHHGFNGGDPSVTSVAQNNVAVGANLTTGGSAATDATGQKMMMDYRSIGDFFRLAKDTSIGTINMGLWYDHQYNNRFQYNVDWTLGGVPVSVLGANGGQYNRLMHDTLDNIQPYAELAWKVTPSLTVTPGVKYAYFYRSINAQVNDSTGLPLNYSHSWSSVLPTLDIHYKIQPGWVAYAQVAKGFLAPKLQLWQVQNPSLSDFQPETTMNYQIGTTWHSDRLTLSADGYYIDFNNYSSIVNKGTTNAYVHNYGGTVFKGLEAEGTVYVGSGFSLYANGSVESAKDKTSNQWITNVPDSTAAAGVIYNRNGWYASVIDKYVGKQYGADITDPISAFNLADAALGYTLNGDVAPGWLQKARINLQVHNITNRKTITAYSGNDNATTGAHLYWTSPERSYFLTLSAHI
jgi:iron complex outermembrane recepter protein